MVPPYLLSFPNAVVLMENLAFAKQHGHDDHVRFAFVVGDLTLSRIFLA